MQQSTITTSYLPSDYRLITVSCLCLFLSLIDSAFGAIFLPTAEELKNLVSHKSAVSYPATILDLSRLPRQIEGEKSYVVLDDMLFDISTIQPNGAVSGNLWPDGNVYYVFESSLSNLNRARWLDAAAEWRTAANVKFLEGTGTGNYILIQDSTENSSQVGMVGLGQQIMNIISWDSKYRIAHEIGHALGLIHEQSRFDRDSYVVIFWNNIIPNRAHNFDIWPIAMTIYGAYDFDSVMHYARADFSQNGQDTIQPVPAYFVYVDTMGQRFHLSQLDRAAMAQRYGQPGGGQELLINGGFESGSTDWSMSGTGAIAQGSFAHVGVRYAGFLGQNNSSATLAHSHFAIPANATLATLSFWLNVVTQETSVGHLYDTLTLNLIDGAGNPHPLATYSEADQGLNQNGDYTPRSFDVTTYRGQSIQIQFVGITDLSLPTTFRIDDVTLLATTPGPTNAALTVLANPGNGGTTTGTGSYPINSTQTISATAHAGWAFIGWNDGNNQATRSVTVPVGGITYTANFTPNGGGTSLVVTNLNSQGTGSLASALANANANPANKTITFNLPGNGPWAIATSATLAVTAPVTIDGTSQPGYNGQLSRVYVEASAGVANVFNLSNHGGTRIKGLGIYNYNNAGVMIENSASGNWIEDCYIGFKQTNGIIFQNRAISPFCTGMEIRGSYNQVHRSTISGVYNGIVVGEPNGQSTGFISTDNLFEGNNVGTDPAGQTTIGYENSSNGISLRAGVKSSWIGSWTLDPSGFNVMAGNGASGIEISHSTDDHNRIFYNYFGVNRGGTRLITGSTNQQAILINNGAQYNAAWGNIIAGNRGAGIVIESSYNWVLGNTIGLNQAQTQALSGQPYGVILRVDNAHTPGVTPQGNAIGGSGAGNMICNQSFNGVEIDFGAGNGVMCNWIGINGSGQAFPNAGWGAYLLNATGNSSYGCFNAWGPNGFGRVGDSGVGGNSIQ